RQEIDSLRPGRGLVCAPQCGRQALHQVDGAQLASLIADDGRGLGTIDLNAAYFLDRKNPQQETAAKFGPYCTKDLLVAELERLRPPAHSDPGGLRCFFVGFGVDHHAGPGARGGEEGSEGVCTADGTCSKSSGVRNHERLELATLDPLLEYGGDLALFAIEHIEDRAQLVSLPIHLESEIAQNQRGDKEREDRNSFFIHGQVLE